VEEAAEYDRITRAERKIVGERPRERSFDSRTALGLKREVDSGVMVNSELVVGFERILVGFGCWGLVLEFCRSRFLGGAFFRGFLTSGGGVRVEDGDGLAVGGCPSTQGKLQKVVLDLKSDFHFLMAALPDDSSSASWKSLFFAALRARASNCIAFFLSALVKGWSFVTTGIIFFG
jgi:hypothetical protein